MQMSAQSSWSAPVHESENGEKVGMSCVTCTPFMLTDSNDTTCTIQTTRTTFLSHLIKIFTSVLRYLCQYPFKGCSKRNAPDFALYPPQFLPENSWLFVTP